jgi:taurine transport system substrate-binding protein
MNVKRFPRSVFALAMLSVLAGAAHAADVTIGYQTGANPAEISQVNGDYDKATHAKLDWRKFDAGAEVITAVASGDVQIAYLGSSPFTVAASRNVPIETILVASNLGSSEALVVRNGTGINSPKDLIGKKIATPFSSTSHYSLLAALKHWHIDPHQVTIVNLNPPAISAAWQRGDIDAAYTWDPALGVAKATGKVLITSGDLAKLGAPTFDVWLVRKDFAKKHPDIVKAFAKVTLDDYQAFNQDPKGWLADQQHIDTLAKVTGAKPEDIPGLLEGNSFPSVAEQRTILKGPITKGIADTARFLKEQGRIDAVLPDYSPFVTARFLPQ